jgi:L,D-transpeptidase catalytic domain
VLPEGKAIRYGAIVGEDGQAWSGVATVGRKEEWPGWTPTEGERRRLGPLPNYVEGGAHNPMGARALYLYAGGKDTLYRIHGTNQLEWIGHAISSGCIRLTNEDVILQPSEDGHACGGAGTEAGSLSCRIGRQQPPKLSDSKTAAHARTRLPTH